MPVAPVVSVPPLRVTGPLKELLGLRSAITPLPVKIRPASLVEVLTLLTKTAETVRSTPDGLGPLLPPGTEFTVKSV